MVERGTSTPFGATYVRGGVNFALVSHHATAVTIVLHINGADRVEVRLDPDRHRTGDVWHALVKGLDGDFTYGFKVDGPAGVLHRFDPDRVLLDPYARAIVGAETWGDEHRRRRSLATPAADDFDWGNDRPLRRPLSETVIYELHVRGFTRHRSAGVMHPGTFAGLIEKIPYLVALGVTAVELMPVCDFDECDRPVAVSPVTGERLLNYWGYHSLAFFAPKASYASAPHGTGPIREFKSLVKAMHAAGIEVILDIVFNHTGEGGEGGPTSSFRGIDNATYYILDPVTGAYRDYTGTGNTLNCNHPTVRELILESLRYWVSEMHVDGFRFDLASVLGRGRDGAVLASPPLIESIAADPVLADTKLIAEAWDATGLYQVGSFPAWGRWAEWNGRFRDDVRRFVRGDTGLAGAVATRLAGSPDLYRYDGRSAHHSVNFVTSHDGFTLRDLVSYNRKHNESNGEDSRDGADENDSWNHGFEGDPAPAPVAAIRRRQQRNFLSLLLLARGVPMLLAGDESGRSQRGNNNAYCHDSELSWIDWDVDAEGQALRRFVTGLIALRRRFPQLRGAGFLDADQHGRPMVEWHGREPQLPDWSPSSTLVVMQLPHDQAESDLLMVANAGVTPVTITLPAPRYGSEWRRIVDTAQPSPDDFVDAADARPIASRSCHVSERSVVVFVSAADDQGERPGAQAVQRLE